MITDIHYSKDGSFGTNNCVTLIRSDIRFYLPGQMCIHEGFRIRAYKKKILHILKLNILHTPSDPWMCRVAHIF
jgi:hypothetical protein